jgi:hypothetical protein
MAGSRVPKDIKNVDIWRSTMEWWTGKRMGKGGSDGPAVAPLAALATLAIAAAFAFFSGCAGSPPALSVVRSDSAGVELVTSMGPDVEAPFHLEREWRLGGLAGELHVTELRPWHVAADNKGWVYVLDAVGRRVFVVDPHGSVVDTLGRPGGGPGELGSPVAVHVAPDGTVGVWDYARGGLVVWRDGQPLPLRRVEGSFWGPDVRLFEWDRSDAVAFVTLSRSPVSRQHLTLSGPARTRVLAEMVAVPERPAEFPTCGIRGIPVPPLFAPELNWDVRAARFLVSVSPDYEVRVHSAGAEEGDSGPGALQAIWRRDLPVRRTTEEMALREVGDGLRIPVTDCTVPPGEVVRGRGYTDVIPAIRRLAVDPEGRAWILRGAVADEPNRVDILDSSGAYLGTLTGDVPIPVTFPSATRLIGLESDEYGVRTVGSWRVVPVGGGD